jgi:hypothetical protein
MAVLPGLARLRAVPWMVVLEAATALRLQWKKLSPDERARMAKLVKKSQGRPSNLSKHERAELKRMVTKLDPAAIGRSLITPLGRGKLGRKR